jgi:hypothetical protein
MCRSTILPRTAPVYPLISRLFVAVHGAALVPMGLDGPATGLLEMACG